MPEQPDLVTPFGRMLSRRGLKLNRRETTTLQVNIGLLCNQTCKHCHLDAGPFRKELMNEHTASEVIAYARRCRFKVIDITGGAPEMNPVLPDLIREFSQASPRVILRSNLSALYTYDRQDLMNQLKTQRVVVAASFPSINQSQTDSQRGDHIFDQSIAALKQLNDIGYGDQKSGLELNLVSNPTGAFMPPDQVQMGKRFRETLMKKWGITFNHLNNFANVPLGRFRKWLINSGNYTAYMQKLALSFNPCALEGVMCRTLASVSWDGFLYDCDFNLSSELPMGGKKMHVSEMFGPPKSESPVTVSDHCYTCTAGAGFT
ncbi:arsenosugar biosynthesis radical SAM (seleno)protein ArsS [Thermodesulfobacteriota bacterium]